MVEELARARLGRGLAALLGDVDQEFSSAERHKGTRRVPIEFLRRNPRNPRSHFAEAELEELAASIRARGIIQPIVVRPLPGLPDAYEIVAGERRWRAAQRAGLHEAPVVVVEADDRLALELAIIENVQRSDLNALEEAVGYEALVAQHGYSQTDLAATLGKSRSHVANTLRLLKLPERVRGLLMDGSITAGHGRALLAVRDPEGVADRIVERSLNVRDVERLAQDEPGIDKAPRRGGRPRREKSVDTLALETALQEALGLIVSIQDRGGAGELRVRYETLDQLEGLCQALRRSVP